MSDEDLQILAVSAFWRDNEPCGVAAGVQFGNAEQGLSFCRQLDALLYAYDETLTSRDDVVILQRQLASLSPRRAELTDVECAGVIAGVHWLQERDHLVPDEWNGLVVVCLYKGALLQCERNPLTMDLDAEMRGKNAVDVTDIVKASEGTLDMGVPAIRATVEHARGGRR